MSKFRILISGDKNEYHDSRSIRKICGVLGMIQLVDSFYLVVATHREYVGVITGHVIWRLAGFELIPYLQSTIHLSDEQKVQNEIYLSMVDRALNTPFFYFSYTYDLSHSLQRLQSLPAELNELGLAERADERFVWNRFLLKDFITFGLRKYCLPLIHGCKLLHFRYLKNPRFNE